MQHSFPVLPCDVVFFLGVYFFSIMCMAGHTTSLDAFVPHPRSPSKSSFISTFCCQLTGILVTPGIPCTALVLIKKKVIFRGVEDTKASKYKKRLHQWNVSEGLVQKGGSALCARSEVCAGNMH